MVPLRQTLAGYLRRLVLGLCCAFPLLAVVADSSEGQETPVPDLKHYATDLSGTLSPEQVAQLDQLLSSFDKTTSTQVVVLMVASLNGEDLEEYSLRVAEANKIGRKGKDNGVVTDSKGLSPMRSPGRSSVRRSARISARGTTTGDCVRE